MQDEESRIVVVWLKPRGKRQLDGEEPVDRKEWPGPEGLQA